MQYTGFGIGQTRQLDATAPSERGGERRLTLSDDELEGDEDDPSGERRELRWTKVFECGRVTTGEERTYGDHNTRLAYTVGAARAGVLQQHQQHGGGIHASR